MKQVCPKLLTDYKLINPDIVKTDSEPNISIEHETRIVNLLETKSRSYESNVQIKRSFDKHKFGDKNTIKFDDKMYRENITVDDKTQIEIFNSNNTFNNNTFTNNFVISSKQQEICDIESATAFTMAVNKSIFSDTGLGNIFDVQ
jgi:hypothetical protein